MQSDRVGKLIYYTLCIVSILGMLLCIPKLPSLSLNQWTYGQINNYMSFQQIAESLEPYGITCEDKLLLTDLGAEFNDPWYNCSKVIDLLCYLGMGSYDPDTFQWIPAQTGVYWFDMEAWDVENMYTNFLLGISALSPDELVISNIQEDHSQVNREIGAGTTGIRFTLNGKDHDLYADAAVDWFDMDILEEMTRIFCAKGGRKAALLRL